MRALKVCRYALLLMIGAYVVTLVLGVAGVISGEAGLSIGTLSDFGMALAAVLCMGVQIATTFSRKRHVKHG